MSLVRRVGAKWRYRAKHWLGRRPRLYHWTYRLRDAYADRLVTADTDICIEGFPRSANSFAVGAFEHAQDEELSIAHHNHLPAPILNAVRRGLPTVVLIRDPVDAVISLRGLQLQIGAIEGKEMPMHVLYTDRLWAWRSFYETVWPLREQVVIAPFKAVIEDFGRVIAAVNARFETDFDVFEHTEAHVSAVRDRRGRHALPSKQRDALKKQARDHFAREVGTEHVLAQATRKIHDQFCDHATVC